MEYSERLTVPVSWWVVGMFFSLTFVTAVGFYSGPVVALWAGGLTAVAVAGALLSYGRTVISVDALGVHAGPALLEWPWVGAVRVHDAASGRARLGPLADHAAWLLVRGYLPAAVEIEVADPADPHPYWLISSRDPAALAAAIERCRAVSAASR